MAVAPSSERWSGGIQPRTMDCSLDTVWDLITDWGRWDRFYPQDLSPAFQVSSRLEQGENGKLGCVRYADLAPKTYSHERLIAVDNDKHYLSYNMEDNNLYGGLRNYVAKVKFSPTSDGKTKLEYWSFEVDPLTKTTWKDYSDFMQFLLGTKLATGLEATAKKLGASKPQTSAHHHHLHQFGHKHQ